MVIKNKLIRVSSSQRSKQSDTTNNFTVNYTNLGMLQKVVSIVVKHVSFTNTFYNITENNNTLLYDTGVSSSIVLEPKFYNITELLAALNASLPSQNELTYDPQTNKLSMLASPTHPIEIKSVAQGSTLNLVLGFEEQGIPAPQIANFQLANQISLQGVQHVFVSSETLSKGSNFVDANEQQEESVVIMVPNDVPFGSIKHYETLHDTLDVINYDSDTNIQNIDIKLLDVNKNLLDTSNHEVSLILKVYYRI